MSRASPVAIIPIAALFLISFTCASCAPASHSSQPRPSPTAPISSRPIGLVGLLALNGDSNLPHAGGMHGTVTGYVVSHPNLGSGLTVRREERDLPVLAFRLNFAFVRAAGRVGLEDFRGRGTLIIYYDGGGYTNEVISGAGSVRGGEEIERDEVEFRGSMDLSTYLIHLNLEETAVATRAFTFRGLTLQTRAYRRAYDVLDGEFGEGFSGVVIASTGTMPWMSASQKLLALSGSPPASGPFRF